MKMVAQMAEYLVESMVESMAVDSADMMEERLDVRMVESKAEK